MRIVSEKYRAVDTMDVIDGLVTKGILTEANVFAMKVCKTRGTTTKHLIRVPFGDQVTLFDSTVQPELLLWNSYQGESSLKASLGFYRFVCSNGMTIGEVFEEVRIRHIKGQTFEQKFDSFFNNLLPILDRGLSGLHEVASKRLDLGKQMEIARALFPQRIAKQIEDRLIFGRAEDRTGNVWQLWNVANEVMRINARRPHGLAFEQRNADLLPRILKEVA
jgi:hypothetical protein